MNNANNNKPSPITSKLGLITGTLLIVLGCWVIYTKPEANKAIAYFMIIYGTIRLGLAAYSSFLKKKREEEMGGNANEIDITSHEELNP